MLLEALDPLVVGHVDDVDREDEPPVEVVQLDIALLAPEQAIILILDLKKQVSLVNFSSNILTNNCYVNASKSQLVKA